MVKLRAKNLLALALSILMLTGTVTDWLPTALAAAEPSAVTEQTVEQLETQDAQLSAADQPETQAVSASYLQTLARSARQPDFQEPDNGRPNLYVDFLGDNIGNGTAENPGVLVAPAAYNKDKRTNYISENSWQGYSGDDVNDPTRSGDILFWIGVGIDRVQVWELLRNSGNKGLTSLELGFYYNDTYIEPYVAGNDYAATIANANINGPYTHNQWGENYHIVRAETGLPVEDDNILRADPITQDVMESPSLDNIRNNRYSDNELEEADADWRMTYVSLELESDDLARRLAGEYTGYKKDENGELIVPDEASGTDADDPANVPVYLMMIPFRVKRYDARGRLCLRLIRDASHFSIGAGNDGVGDGAEGSYAAWERVTTRNTRTNRIRIGRAWSGNDSSLMALLADATSESDLANRLGVLELQEVDILGDGTYVGLRKNLSGDLYEEEDLADAAARLWTLRALVLADTAAGGLKEQYYKASADNTYHYFDLTPAQVQAYIVTCLEEEGKADGVAPTTVPTASAAITAMRTAATIRYHWSGENEGKTMDLKLQLRFAGDLNIWRITGNSYRTPDVFHRATLLIQNGGGSENTARLSVQSDKGANPVYVDVNRHFISNLQGGTGMEVHLTVQAGYEASIWVYYEGAEMGADNRPLQMGWPYATVTNEERDKHYTFVMPDEDVFVLVVFKPGNTRDYILYLSEIPKPYESGYMLGNETYISSFCYRDPSPDDGDDAVPVREPVSINSFDPRGSHPTTDSHGPGPKMTVSKNEIVTLDVYTHPDYEAWVHVFIFSTGENLDEFISMPADTTRFAGDDDNPADPTILILPQSGTITFKMTESDMDVVVEYRKADTKTAMLEVWHVEDAADADKVKDVNIAQLAYLSYNDQAAVSTAYSGQVYEQVDPNGTGDSSERYHSAVKKPSYKTTWVPYSASTVSNSRGGDTGRTGRAWTGSAAALMTTLAKATDVNDLANPIRLNALDLLGADLLGDGSYMGLRKNLDGEIYGDDELRDVATLLWELRSKILADPIASGKYYKESDDKTYHYFDLTPAQVQAYRIACLEVDAIFRANQKRYRDVYNTYQEIKQVYDAVHKVSSTSDAAEPIPPLEPLRQVISATGRTYQGTDYIDNYIASYERYMAKYDTYITSLRDGTSSNTNFPEADKPARRPDPVEVELPDAATALNAVQTAIDTYGWGDNIVDAPSAEVEVTAAVATRSGRTVWLLVEADAGYEVEGVRLLDKDSRVELRDVAVASTSFKNVYTFSMPEVDCIVQVRYKLRVRRSLWWQVIGANGMEDNVAVIEAYQITAYDTAADLPSTDAQWDNIYPTLPTGSTGTYATLASTTEPLDPTRPTLARRTNKDHEGENPYPDDDNMKTGGFPVEGVLAKSQVTIRTTCDKDYKVTVSAFNGLGGREIQVTSNDDKSIHTFTVQSESLDDVVVTITYTPKDESIQTAYIHVVGYDGAYADTNYSGVWTNENLNRSIITAMSDTELHGAISLAEGFYIYASYAVGEHGTYPYTLDGNGYNNGLGAGNLSTGASRAPVRLETVMPNEDLHIYIVVRKGLPPDEPANALTVIVVDDDNTDTPVADNWARATVYAREDDVQRVALSAAGKGATGGGALQVTHYGKVEDNTAVMAGDRVELELSATTGFYIAEVALQPSHLGGDLEWLPVSSTIFNNGGRKLQFTMPAGSTTVTVRFRELDENTTLLPSYYVHAQEIETDRDGATVTSEYDVKNPLNNNRITSANSATIQSYTSGNSYSLDPNKNPEQVPSSESGTGAGVAGETVTMTFQVKPGWYVQSVAVMTDGSARPVDYAVVPGSGDNDGNGGTFTADIVMPAGDAWFIVKYRQCPADDQSRPEIPEYAITLMVIDDDNTADPADDNRLTASFSGANESAHGSIQVSHYTTNAIQYIHAGDQVELHHDLAPGYSMDYMIVNPTELGLVPTYVSPDTARFTMPARNITVVAKIVKKSQQKYTADLILHPPAGMDVDDLGFVGQGTFTNEVDGVKGSLTGYYANAIYSLLLAPGEKVDFDLYAFDGYYIRAVTVEPAKGADPSLTGSFSRQSGGFVMPAANSYVNVYFEKLWPDQVKYDLTLKVNDSSGKANNYAYFDTYGGVDFSTNDRKPVRGGETLTVRNTVLDGEEVYVALNREDGYYYDPASIQVTDSSGAEISWRMAAWRKDKTSVDVDAVGIAFLMPPRSTTVEITYRKDNRPADTARKAVFHIVGGTVDPEIIRLYRNGGTQSGDFAWSNGGSIEGLHPGDVLHVRVEDLGSNRRVAAAYAFDEATGEQLMLPMTLVPDGGRNSFLVPTLPAGVDATGKDIHVYVIMETKAEGDLSRTMNLVVQGPQGSGTATLFETEDTANSVTATAGATGSATGESAVGHINAAQGSDLTVTMDPASGYYISQLTVTDNQGARVSYEWISMLENDDTDPSTWYHNPDRQITLRMPATGGTVQVTYAKIPTDDTDPDNPKPKKYTAQVVVNDDQYDGLEPSPNNATLSNQALGQGPGKLVTAEAGQWVDLDITVKAGYRIELVFVSPQSFGIKPQLPLGDLDSQTTGFYMPAGDVTVYVKFVRDDQRVFNAYLRVDKDSYRGEVDEESDLGANNADIYSERTGLRGPIDCTDNDVMVQAVANREWVTVRYRWGEDSWVSGLTVKDGAGQNVPFTQVDEHTITLPMVARDVIITLFYEKGEPPTPDDPPDDPTPALTPVRLHVIDMTDDHSITDDPSKGWGRVSYTSDGSLGSGVSVESREVRAGYIKSNQTDAEWDNWEMIWVPAGRDVLLEAFSDQGQGIYIHSAYVLYRDGGQMISCNLQPNQVDPDTDEEHRESPDHGFYWHRSATFRAHPDYNDVYVFLTTEKPEADEYAATLMLKSPTGDTGSAAAIWTWDEEADDFKDRATVKANGDHGRITAKRKETVKVTVTPMEGYDVDYILMTPLGIPITPKLDKNGNYTFTMPGYNVNVCVYLKRNNKRTFEARIHYTQQWDPDTDPVGEHNEGVIWWDRDDSTRISAKANRQTLPNSDESVMKVAENETVTLDITLDDPYVVLAAYVLQGGAIVPLSASLEGTKENRSMVDNSLPDGTAQFTMPSGNVDVFVVTTTTPPTGVWHTAVLTVQDPDNSGDCEATIERPEDYTANYLPDPRYETAYSVPPTANHKFISVREGQTVTVSVAEDTTGKYTFDRPPLLTHSATYGANLNPVSSSATQYVYQFTVGPCNSAVLVNFKKKEAETRPLTVVIEDPDNPGNNTVRQTATVTAGSLAPLTLTSVSSLGAYQVISGVEDGSAVTVRAEAHQGYKAYAYWSYGTTRERVTLTQTGNVYTGAVSMPPQAAQLTITYYKAWEATVTIYDPARSSSQAQMGAEVPADITFPDGTRNYVSVGAVTVSPALGQMNSASISDLDTGTRLTTAVTPAGNSRVVAVLATDANGTRFLDPEKDTGSYVCTMDKSDMDIAVIMGAENDGHYVASVVTRGKPASAADPAIAVSSSPVSFGSIWSVADAGDTVTVTVPPVDGYRVTVTTNDPAVTVTAGAGNTYTATMPAANLQFTVTYEKEPTLTLRVLEPESTKTLDPRNDTLVTGGAKNLTQDAETTSAVKDNKITITATPSDKTVQVTDITGGIHDCPVVVKEITYRTPTNTNVLYTNSGSETGAVTEDFFMPDGDVTVVVRYGLKLPDGVTPNIPDDEEDYYTAWVETAGDDGLPENRVNAIWNVTKPGTYPTGTPDWACGAPNNEMKLSISVKDGYYVTVTAKTADGTSVPVIQQGDTGLCTASVTMPGEDVFITVTYDKIENKPENEKEVQVTLVLVGHGGLLGNSAEVTGGSLTDLAASGQTVNHLGDGDRVYAISGTAKVGDELRLSANWAGSYQITRATLSLPKDASVTTPSTNDAMLPDSGDYVSTGLALSEYGTNKTARVTLPAEGAVITVYYSNIFQATLHIEPHGVDYQDVNDNQTSATDGSATIINRHLDRLENLGGGETIATTAKPGDGQRLVGVVWESATKGAAAATPNKTVPNQYDFTMQEENVDFYAVYESASEKSYIAKVRFDGTDHLGDSGNAVTITNTSDSAAPKGKYWTAAKEGNAVVINVKVAPGYKAEIITAKVDDQTKVPEDCKWEDSFHYYISRVNFLPNLTLGKDATFSMPADTDATVTIRFTKGYDLALEVADTSHITSGLNQADVNVGSLHGESDGTNITYTPADAVETDSSGTKRVVTHGVEAGPATVVTTTVTPASNDVPYKVYRRSLFTGTERVDKLTGTPPTQPPSPYDYEMPSADVLETVLFYNDATPLLAKVEVKGESDINGNSATPIVDVTDPATTTTGTVWTTTADGNTIDLTITVAQGYIAKVKVRRDNKQYYDHPDDESQWELLKAPEEYSNFQHETPEGFENMVGDTEVQFGFQDGAGAFGNYISDAQHFRFEMPSAGNANTAPVTDVTVIVEFVFAGVMPQPFDPDNPAMDNIDLDRGFIYGENLGDFALIDIPTLYQDQKLFNTDNYNKTDPNDSKSKVKFNFFLYNAGKDEYTPLTLGVDVLLEPEDEKTLWKGTDPYNYYNYETNLADGTGRLDDDTTREDKQRYTGSRFKLVPTEADELTGNRTDGAQALYDILNNNSSLARDENNALATNSKGKYYTTLYVMAEDAIGQKSAYTQVWIRPHFTVEVQVISYAPTHTTTASLYKLLDQDAMDLATGYKDADGNVVPGVDRVEVKTKTDGQWDEWTREFKHYRWNETDKPYLSNYTAYDGPVVGAGKYYQKVGVMSSELLGSYGAGYDPGANLLTNVLPDVTAVYALTLEKVSSLTYTRVNLDLLKDVDTTTGTAPIYYNANTLTYTVSDIIYLITGDVDGNGYTKWQDYDTVYTYVFRNIPWNNTQTEAPDPADPNYATLQARWQLSTYNPDSMAYRCDLNGDRVLTYRDVELVQTIFDYNRSVDDYLWTRKLPDDKTESVLPFGFGSEKGSYTALFALRDPDDVFPVEPDGYWDSLVDPNTTEAPPLNTIYVDVDGNLWDSAVWLAAADEYGEDELPSSNRDTGGGEHRRDDALMEVPVGDEVMEHPGAFIDLPAFDPGPVVELPAFDPGVTVDLPSFDPEEPAPGLPQNTDNGPGEVLAETPADITTEE